MDQTQLQEFKKALSLCTNILILLPQYVNTDTAAASTSLYNFLSQVMKKNVFLASSNKIPVKFSSFLDTFAIEEKAHITEIKPLQYVITVKDTEEDLELAVNRKDNNIEIIMVPKVAEIDMSKVTVKTSGTKFDLFITINTESQEELGSIYTESIDIFKNTKIVAINNFNSSPYAEIVLSDQSCSTSSEIIFEFLQSFDSILDDNIKSTLFEGITAGTDGLHKYNSTATLERIIKLLNNRSLKDKLNDLFYSYSHEGLEVRKRIFSNLQKKNNVSYSILSERDLTEAGITSSQLEGIDFLPFNFEDDVDAFMLSYPFNNQNKILIESKNFLEIYTKLKDENLNVTRSSSLVCVVTSSTIEEIIMIISSTSQNTKENQALFETQQRKDEVLKVPPKKTPFNNNIEPNLINKTNNKSPFENLDEIHEKSGPFVKAD